MSNKKAQVDVASISEDITDVPTIDEFTENKVIETKTKAVATKSEVVKATIASDARVRALENKRRNLAIQYKREKKIPVQVSPLYIPYFGRVMPIIINGIRIDVPCNNEVYEIPETFAAELKKKVRNIDNMLQKQKRVSNVQSNREMYAGQMKF